MILKKAALVLFVFAVVGAFVFVVIYQQASHLITDTPFGTLVPNVPNDVSQPSPSTANQVDSSQPLILSAGSSQTCTYALKNEYGEDKYEAQVQGNNFYATRTLTIHDINNADPSQLIEPNKFALVGSIGYVWRDRGAAQHDYAYSVNFDTGDRLTKDLPQFAREFAQRSLLGAKPLADAHCVPSTTTEVYLPAILFTDVTAKYISDAAEYAQTIKNAGNRVPSSDAIEQAAEAQRSGEFDNYHNEIWVDSFLKLPYSVYQTTYIPAAYHLSNYEAYVDPNGLIKTSFDTSFETDNDVWATLEEIKLKAPLNPKCPIAGYGVDQDKGGFLADCELLGTLDSGENVYLSKESLPDVVHEHLVSVAKGDTLIILDSRQAFTKDDLSAVMKIFNSLKPMTKEEFVRQLFLRSVG